MVGKANNPSYGWRSIWTARAVLNNELLRTIGTGADTKIWEDPWIPGDPARAAKPLGTEQDMDLRVHHLIDFDTSSWNEVTLSELIAPEDVPKILAIKTSRLGREDGYQWKHTKSGEYTVRSGYELVNQRRRNSTAQGILEPSTTGLKKAVWKLKTSRKIKHFLWQALSGFITAASRLFDRHYATERTCLRCGAEDETINHIIFECPPALQCWALSDIPTPPGLFPCNSLFTNLDHLLWRAVEHGVPKENLEMFPWLIWFICKARNNKLFNGVEESPKDTLQLAITEASNWRVAQLIPIVGEETSEENQNALRTTVRQEVEDEARLRCQVDASWTRDGEKTGLGLAIMEGDKKRAVGLKQLQSASSALHAEAESLLWAMKVTQQQGYKTMTFQTDCLQLVKLIEREKIGPPWQWKLRKFLLMQEILIVAHSFIYRVVRTLERTAWPRRLVLDRNLSIAFALILLFGLLM